MGSGEKQVSVSKQLIDAEEVQILKNIFWKGFTDHEVNYCIKVANGLNLSPILRQIHFIKREDGRGNVTITNQTGIDGLRLAAQRTGEYAGSDDAIFEYDPSGKFIKKATVSIYRIVNGMKCTFTASARWEEYYPGGKKAFMWDKMTHVMISKCAEAQALRKGFPAELSSLYVNEEMDQSHTDEKDSKQDPFIQLPITPVVGSGAFCEACETELLLSKEGKGYYCPKWKDGEKTGVKHTRFPVAKLEEFKSYRAEAQTEPSLEDDLLQD